MSLSGSGDHGIHGHDIARVCHEANRAYCLALGDASQKPWNEAPQWARDSAIKGVQFHLANPNADDAASHDEWVREKVATGWVVGPEKNERAKTHPNLVPFNDLSKAHQIKDRLFRSIVHALR